MILCLHIYDVLFFDSDTNMAEIIQSNLEIELSTGS